MRQAQPACHARVEVDDTFASFMDLCLVCRACEDVCPAHVPFGRMMEAAREQIEPMRSRRARFARWMGLDIALPHKKLLWMAAVLQPVVRPFMPRRIRDITPKPTARFRRLPAGGSVFAGSRRASRSKARWRSCRGASRTVGSAT